VSDLIDRTNQNKTWCLAQQIGQIKTRLFSNTFLVLDLTDRIDQNHSTQKRIRSANSTKKTNLISLEDAQHVDSR
jgi:hypothetical protein